MVSFLSAQPQMLSFVSRCKIIPSLTNLGNRSWAKFGTVNNKIKMLNQNFLAVKTFIFMSFLF